MCTIHKAYTGDARLMNKTPSNSVDIVVTSPPYPMIEMWDECFAKQDEAVSSTLSDAPDEAYELMHQQ